MANIHSDTLEFETTGQDLCASAGAGCVELWCPLRLVAHDRDGGADSYSCKGLRCGRCLGRKRLKVGHRGHWIACRFKCVMHMQSSRMHMCYSLYWLDSSFHGVVLSQAQVAHASAGCPTCKLISVETPHAFGMKNVWMYFDYPGNGMTALNKHKPMVRSVTFTHLW